LRSIHCFFVLVFCLTFFCFPVQAAEAELYGQLDTESLWDALPEETISILLDSNMQPDSMQDASVPTWLSALSGAVSDELYAPFKTGARLIALILLARIIRDFGNGSLNHAVQVSAVFAAAVLLVKPISALIEQTEQMIGILSAVLTASIPVYAGILVLSGHAVTGSTYGALTLSWGSGIAAVSRQLLLPLTRIYFVFSIVTSVSDIGLKQIADALYRSVKWLLILGITIFTGILSLQTLLSAQTDLAAAKAAKMVASGAVPIVGGAFSDALSILGTSVGLVKSGVGAFGLLASLTIFLPICFRAGAWIFIQTAAAFAADLLEMPCLSDLLTGCVSVLKMLVAVLCSVGLISLVAAAVLLCVRSAYG